MIMSQKMPLFSIIIPTYNRPNQLTSCLNSIVRLDYPHEKYEVIVVDDGSEISLDDTVSPFQGETKIKLITQANTGPATARNSGAAEAKGEFLAFTDDDCKPASDWLKKLEIRFSSEPDCLIGGKILNTLLSNSYSTAGQMLIDYLYDYYNKDHNQLRFFTTNNLAVPKCLFHEIDGFDTTYPRSAAEDREFCYRWQNHGYRMIYAPEARVYHSHELSFLSFGSQHFNYGRGAFCFHNLCSRHGLKRIKLEPLSFYLNMLKYPFSQLMSKRAFQCTLLLAISQTAHTAGFFWERSRKTKK